MLIKFDEIEEVTIPHLNDGAGAVSAKMYMEPVSYTHLTLPTTSRV